ncbi:hypothetical protein ACFQ1L_36505 [Phytohabitans flavus]|uniref:hypothetical protein n=1 Tax=Phytohabitans flavus TaxID=1076124 RepID=UPI003627E995
MFRTAMGGDPAGIQVPGAPDDATAAGDDDRPKPRFFLMRALSRLVDVGCLRPEDTSRAAMASWATVHGLSIMLLDLLPQLASEQKDAAIGDALSVLVAGLTTPRA